MSKHLMWRFFFAFTGCDRPLCERGQVPTHQSFRSFQKMLWDSCYVTCILHTFKLISMHLPCNNHRLIGCTSIGETAFIWNTELLLHPPLRAVANCSVVQDVQPFPVPNYIKNQLGCIVIASRSTYLLSVSFVARENIQRIYVWEHIWKLNWSNCYNLSETSIPHPRTNHDKKVI